MLHGGQRITLGTGARNIWLFFFLTGFSLAWSFVGLAVQPPSPRDLPVPTFSVLGFQTHMADLAFYTGSGNGIQVLVLRRPALCPLRYLLRLLYKKIS